jgi:hypothetical protein
LQWEEGPQESGNDPTERERLRLRMMDGGRPSFDEIRVCPPALTALGPSGLDWQLAAAASIDGSLRMRLMVRSLSAVTSRRKRSA